MCMCVGVFVWSGYGGVYFGAFVGLCVCGGGVVMFVQGVYVGTMLGGYPCHHGMARPRVADGRDGLQLEVSCEYIE
jgi:hypothetical protein